MTITATRPTGRGSAHGGYLFTVVDSTCALVCNSGGTTTVAAGADVVFVAPGHVDDVLVAEGMTRAAHGRSGITDVRVTGESDGALIAEFRGRYRLPPRWRDDHGPRCHTRCSGGVLLVTDPIRTRSPPT